MHRILHVLRLSPRQAPQRSPLCGDGRQRHVARRRRLAPPLARHGAGRSDGRSDGRGEGRQGSATVAAEQGPLLVSRRLLTKKRLCRRRGFVAVVNVSSADGRCGNVGQRRFARVRAASAGRRSRLLHLLQLGCTEREVVARSYRGAAPDAPRFKVRTLLRTHARSSFTLVAPPSLAAHAWATLSGKFFWERTPARTSTSSRALGGSVAAGHPCLRLPSPANCDRVQRSR